MARALFNSASNLKTHSCSFYLVTLIETARMMRRCTSSECNNISDQIVLSGDSVRDEFSAAGFLLVVFNADLNNNLPGFEAEFSIERVDNACIACQAGTYTNSSTRSVCNLCPPGQMSNAGATFCSQCAPGKFNDGSFRRTSLKCKGNCACAPSFGASHGTITDGIANYVNNAMCSWTFSAAGGADIELVFTSFDTELAHDFVTVYACESSDCLYPEELASLSGRPASCISDSEWIDGISPPGTCAGDYDPSPSIYCPLASTRANSKGLTAADVCCGCGGSGGYISSSTVYTSSTGFLLVEFTSDETGNAAGFEAAWRVTEMPACADCEAGKYADVSGASACSRCPEGTYSNSSSASSASACVPCAADANSPAGSADKSACFCNAGFYGNGAASCDACFENAVAPMGSSDCTCKSGFVPTGTTRCDMCLPGAFVHNLHSRPCSVATLDAVQS